MSTTGATSDGLVVMCMIGLSSAFLLERKRELQVPVLVSLAIQICESTVVVVTAPVAMLWAWAMIDQAPRAMPWIGLVAVLAGVTLHANNVSRRIESARLATSDG